MGKRGSTSFLCTLWTLDIHTHCDYGHIILFQGPNLLPPVLLFSVLFLSELPLLLSICSFSCLRRDQGSRCPENWDSSYDRRGILNRWVCTLGGRRGFATSWLCIFWYPVTDFWTPASVYEIPNPLPPPPMQVLQWLRAPFLSSLLLF